MFILIITVMQAALFFGMVGGLTVTTLEYQECKIKDFKGSVEVNGNFTNCKDLKYLSKYDKENK